MDEYSCCPPQNFDDEQVYPRVENENYIILTPITAYKLYSLERFLKNVINFKPSPKEVVFCSEPEIKKEILKWRQLLQRKKIELVVLTLSQKALLKAPSKTIERITISRNYLRRYFISTPYDWALWLDSDIFPEPIVVKKFLRIALFEKYLAVTNPYPGRWGKRPWIGMGCTLTHKAICKAIKFQCSPFIWQGKEVGYISEDFYFLGLLDRLDPFLQGWFGWKARIIGTFVSVIHEVAPGVEKILDKSNQEIIDDFEAINK